MNLDEQLDFFRNIYENEHSRNHSLNSQMAFGVTILAVLVGAMSTLFRSYTSAKLGETDVCLHDRLPSSFLLVFALPLLPIAASFYHLTRARLDKVYKHMAGGEDIRGYILKKADKWKRKTFGNTELAEMKTSETVKSYLARSYARAAHVNAAMNDQKSTHTHDSLKYAVRAVLYLTPSVALYYSSVIFSLF